MGQNIHSISVKYNHNFRETGLRLFKSVQVFLVEQPGQDEFRVICRDPHNDC